MILRSFERLPTETGATGLPGREGYLITHGLAGAGAGGLAAFANECEAGTTQDAQIEVPECRGYVLAR